MIEDAVAPQKSLRGSRAIIVTCPVCRRQTPMKCPMAVLDVALNTWNQMNLYAACCDVYWGASDDEVRAIREFLAPAGWGI